MSYSFMQTDSHPSVVGMTGRVTDGHHRRFAAFHKHGELAPEFRVFIYSSQSMTVTDVSPSQPSPVPAIRSSGGMNIASCLTIIQVLRHRAGPCSESHGRGRSGYPDLIKSHEL